MSERERNIHRVSSTDAGWPLILADLLENAADGDIIVVSSSAMVELAENALKRRTKYKYLRIMTRETYAEIEG